jgi:hypothetical protein
MNLQASIENALERWSPETSEPTCHVAVDDGRFEIVLVEVDSLACAFKSVTLYTHRLVGARLAQLRPLAESLGKRLSYLLEDVQLLEVDREVNRILMRSVPPLQDAEGASYYELLIGRGEMRLCRYQKTPGTARRVIPAKVTREVLQRIAADLVAVVANTSPPQEAGESHAQ